MLDYCTGPNCKFSNGESGLPPVDEAEFTMKNVRIIDRSSGKQRMIYFKTVE
jgi:hypothetical protein